MGPHASFWCCGLPSECGASASSGYDSALLRPHCPDLEMTLGSSPASSGRSSTALVHIPFPGMFQTGTYSMTVLLPFTNRGQSKKQETLFRQIQQTVRIAGPGRGRSCTPAQAGGSAPPGTPPNGQNTQLCQQRKRKSLSGAAPSSLCTD